MPDFHQHLKEIRKAKGSTQKQVAEYLGIKERSYQKLEAGVSKPSFDTLIALADFFGISLDYLARGANDDENLPSRLLACRKSKGVTRKEVADSINISEEEYQRYEAGEHTPTLEIASILADYFGVSIDYLAGRTENTGRL